MLHLKEYLKEYKKDRLLQLLINSILAIGMTILIWVKPLLTDLLKLELSHKILLSIMSILSLIIIILYSYIRYSYKQNDLNFKLQKYYQDNKFGFLVHKETKSKICINCFYQSHKEIEVVPINKDKYKCPIKTCGQIYPIEHIGAISKSIDPPDPHENRLFNRKRDLGF